MTARLKIGHLILIFALAALPFAAAYALYYPDERHYTDGALQMLQHGDWLVPHTATGAPRLQKPPLAYWTVATSFNVFGAGVPASRLPFLLASCGTLWLTYRLARRLSGNAETALVAAIVLMSHPQFFLCSVRSMPDALLVFFSTLSLYGFLRLIVFEEFEGGAFWMAYGGAAGAALSKGLLGAGIVLFAWAFVFWQKRDWQAVKKIIHLPALATAVIVVLAWFISVLAKSGRGGMHDFFDDQVTGNMHGHWWSPLGRIPLFALILVFNFLPWSLAVAEWFVRKFLITRSGAPNGEREETGAVSGRFPMARKFVLAWTALLIVGFALGANVSLRYLLPAAPLMSVVLADWLQAGESAHLFFSLQRILRITLAVLVLAVVTAGYIASQWPMPAVVPVLMCGLMLSGIVVLGLGVWRHKSLSPAAALGVALLLGWMVFFVGAMPILLPDRAQQIAMVLRPAEPSAPLLLVGDVKLASRVRVLLGKKWTVVQTDWLTPADAVHYQQILIPANAAREFIGRGWMVQVVAANFSVPARGELWRAVLSRRLPDVLARHAQQICLATRR